MIKTIAIIGAGNGGCAAAAHLAHRGFDIRLYGRSPATCRFRKLDPRVSMV